MCAQKLSCYFVEFPCLKEINQQIKLKNEQRKLDIYKVFFKLCSREFFSCRSHPNSNEIFEDVVTRLSLHENIQTCFETWYQRDGEWRHDIRYDRAAYQFILEPIDDCSICLGVMCRRENLIIHIAITIFTVNASINGCSR